MGDRSDQLRAALNRLAKWRTVFTGWQLGTRSDTDPEAAAVRDQREMLLMLRVEVSALTALLVEKGVCTEEEWQIQMLDEIEAMQKMLEDRFPGFQATDLGMAIDPAQAMQTMKGWKP